MKCHALIFGLFMLLLTSGCKETPSEDMAREIVTRYLSARNYTVKNMEITEIREGSMSNLVYMAKPAYTVVIKTITLEAVRDTAVPIPLKKGQQVTYTNAKIKVREKNRQQDQWEVSVLSGIPIFGPDGP